MVCSARRFLLCITLCYFVLFSPFSIAITSLGIERADNPHNFDGDYYFSFQPLVISIL